MRSFWAGLALALFLAAGAGVALNFWPLSTEGVFYSRHTTM